MSKIVSKNQELNFIPSAYDSSNSTFASYSSLNNGLNDIDGTNSYARFTVATTQYYAYYNFSVTGIPENAFTSTNSDTYCTYTFTVTSVHTIIVSESVTEHTYVKLNNTWTSINQIYKKESNIWTEKDSMISAIANISNLIFFNS